MAAVAASKKIKSVKKASLKKTITDLNCRLVSTSEEAIETAVNTGEKYQKLFAKTVKKSEPIIEKQVDMVFETLESIKGQVDHGTVRFKKLIGWKNIKKNTTSTFQSIKKSTEEKVDAITTELNISTKSIPSLAKTKNVSPSKKNVKKSSTDTTKKVNDLKIIDGIGPKMEKILKAGGISSVNELANTTIAKIEKVIEKSGSTFRAINPEAWLTQANQIIK